jgi:AcrR family transcriptional regulator
MTKLVAGPQPEPQTRRRGAALEEALLEAAWHQLQDRGYAALSMDAVAARAGTSKTVLYRRWRTRAELALATIRKYAHVPEPDPDTGTLRKDVMAVLQWLSDRYKSFPDVMQGLMIELPEADQAVSQTSLLALARVVDRAALRGELATDAIAPRLLRVPLDLARYEMFTTRKPLARRQIEEIVDSIFLPLVAASGRENK